MNRNLRGTLLFVSLAVLAIACRISTGRATPSPPALAVPTPIATGITAIVTTALPATNTPGRPTPTPTAETDTCTYDAAFVTDVTVPDDTDISAGSTFLKIWRMRNSGTCSWEAGSRWVFGGGRQMGGPDSVLLPIISPGETADIAVALTAPTERGTYAGNWQMRRPDGEAVGEIAFVRIRVAASDNLPAPTPTVAVPSTPSPGTGSGPIIYFFRANVTAADPGDSISLEWDTDGATTITIYHLLGSGQLGLPFWEVDANGSLNYDIDPGERNATRFVLFANDGAQTVQATVTVLLNCLDAWFFSPAPDVCPAAPELHSPAAQQQFEQGVMIWIQAQDLVIVLFADGRSRHWRAFADDWQEGDPQNDPGIQPPTGLFQPQRGFGLVWREQIGVRDRLGWATSPESGFETVVQVTSRYKYNDTYVKAPDGSVWELKTEGSGWREFSP